jgi:transmembrane sensor
MDNQTTQQLLQKYIEGACSAEEQLLVENWLEHSEIKNNAWYMMGNDDRAKYVLKIRSRLLKSIQSKPVVVRRLWPQIAAAAILIIAGAGIWLYAPRPFINLNAEIINQNDIAPGKNRATLTFANGKTIKLSDAKTGLIVNASSLKYNDGTEVAALQNASRNEVMLTTTTPLGGTYQVTLPDGSKVWLNAASSLKFPSTFVHADNQERRVELAGEAYFEVSKDQQHPFAVYSRGQKVQVLGTHFNINCYQDEESVKTTLLEGSVNISPLKGGNDVVLRPDQQAVLADNNRITVKEIDAEVAIDWKNGDFIFKGESLESAMRKVARWYNVDVVYGPGAPKDLLLIGSVSRSRSILAVLELLERTGTVKVKAEGRKITIL